MVFLPGDHTLDTNITVVNVSTLTMRGESSSGDRATVVCSGPVGFNFMNMVGIEMQSLAFTSCSRCASNDTISLNVAVVLLQSSELSLVNCFFHNNFGNVIFLNNTKITLIDNNFMHNYCASNSCVGGGGIIAVSSNLTFTGNTTFLENRANRRPGGIEMHNCSMNSTGSIYFINNSNSNGVGGAITAVQSSHLRFTGTSIFVGNSAAFAGDVGGAIYLQGSTMSFSGISNFHSNSGFGGGAISANFSAVSFNGTSSFNDNYGKLGGAICAVDSTELTFNGTITFSNNGYDNQKINLLGDNYGGGVYMMDYSNFSILPNTTVYWENNHAYLGGAIYIVDNEYSYCHTSYFPPPKREECFFQLPGQNLSNASDIRLVFKNNSAHDAGSVLYGGVIDNCELTGLDSYSSGEVFNMLAHIEDDNTTSVISSYPFRICQCENNLPNCNKSSISRSIYPGETFTVSVVVVGQRNGAVPSRVIVHIKHVHNSGDLYENVTAKLPNGSQHLQQTGKTCTDLNYTVHSLSSYTNKNLELYADDLCSTFSGTLIINLNINQSCPPGFSLLKSEASCVCEQRLQKYTNSCTITNGLGQITRQAGEQFWVGYDDSNGLILNPICPFDYCVTQTVAISHNTDVQCAPNRSGLLCGACTEGYSLVLGTFHCKQCTNSHLFLLIPFAVMGVALVFLLVVCKLTVATGTLSGLVFYANIVGVNRDIFIPVESTDALSIFIAWLNFDFGVETCFFDGMDAYSKTWLQFVFPLYLWLLVGLIIVISHFSNKFAKLLGNNPVAVLATLILLSYTKILRTFTTAITFTYLEYPTYNKSVWLFDANIDYLGSKHIPLFLVAVLIFVLLFLPYTFLLLFGQWLPAISHLRFFSWVNRLKPFMDSYHAPYKAKHRYWPGLLLVLRFILFIVFAIQFHPQRDIKINLLVILVGTGVLFIWAWFTGGVYRNWCLDALEGSFVLNLTILTAVTMYTNCLATDISADRNYKQLAVWYTSVSIALITFIVIFAYHIFQQLRHTKLCKKIPKLKLTDKKVSFQQDANDNPTSVAATNYPEVEHFTRLREPLLEDEPENHYHTF